MIHATNMNQVKKPQRFDFFLTNIIINALSSQKVNYIIFFLKAGHSAHKMVKSTHTSTMSTSNIHNRYILCCTLMFDEVCQIALLVMGMLVQDCQFIGEDMKRVPS